MPAPTLTSRERAALRSRAHELKPVAQIGKEGLTEPVLASLRQAFNTRDLVKVRVQEMAPQPTRDMAQVLAEALDDVAVVQVMGRTVTLYRPRPDKGTA